MRHNLCAIVRVRIYGRVRIRLRVSVRVRVRVSVVKRIGLGSRTEAE